MYQCRSEAQAKNTIEYSETQLTLGLLNGMELIAISDFYRFLHPLCNVLLDVVIRIGAKLVRRIVELHNSGQLLPLNREIVEGILAFLRLILVVIL